MRSSGSLARRLFQLPKELCFLDAIPPVLFEGALVKAGKDRDRHGVKLPMRLVLQLIPCLAVFRGQSIPAVLDLLAGIVGTPLTWRGRVPHPTSIAAARDRLGWRVVRDLFRRFSDWLRRELLAEHAWLGGLQVVALDGTCLRTPDTADCEGAFGRPGTRNGSGGFPQLRCVAVVHTLTHLVLAAAFGPSRGKGSGELSLAEHGLLDQLRSEWLVLMDRGFCSYKWLRQLQERGIPFLVRLKTGKNAVIMKRLRSLKRGRDWRVEFPVPASLRPRAGARPLRGLRLVKLQRKGYRPVWMLTSLENADLFTYEEIVKLYLDRWEVEFCFREVKTELIAEKVQFRSRTADRVRQEAYGLLIAYNAVRLHMAVAAGRVHLEPRRLSFARCLFATTVGLVLSLASEDVEDLMSSYVIPRRRPRRYPRVVKMPVSKFAANRTRRNAS